MDDGHHRRQTGARTCDYPAEHRRGSSVGERPEEEDWMLQHPVLHRESQEEVERWERQKELYPGFAEYEQKTAREIPVIGFPDGALVATADIAARIQESARQGLDAAVNARQGRGVQIESVLREGAAQEEIRAVAEETAPRTGRASISARSARG